MLFDAWYTLRDLEDLRRQIGTVFDDFGTSGWLWPFSRVSFLPGRSPRGYPLLNVYDKEDQLLVEALAPGLDTESLEVTVEGNSLRIEGQKMALSQEIKAEAYHRKERSAGRFVRTLTLPGEVDTGAVSANYRNGLLLITLPKVESARPKKVSVKVD